MARCISLFAALLLLSCKGDYQIKVEEVWIPQASSIAPVPEGVILKISDDGSAPPLPSAAVIKIAAPRHIPWSRIKELTRQIYAAGKTPILLVGKRKKLGAFIPSDDLQGDTSITSYVTRKGKFCVGPPNAKEFKCTQRSDKLHADRAGIRQLVREAHKGYGLSELTLQAASDMEWADTIRAIDGARTCCGETSIRVSLKAGEPPI